MSVRVPPKDWNDKAALLQALHSDSPPSTQALHWFLKIAIPTSPCQVLAMRIVREVVSADLEGGGFDWDWPRPCQK